VRLRSLAARLPELLRGLRDKDPSMFNCPVCHEKIARHVGSAAAGLVELECRRCGHFKLSEFSAADKLRDAGPEKRALVCSRLWDQNAFGSVPTIDEHNIDALLSLPPLPFFEKAKRLLIHLSEKTTGLGQAFDLDELPTSKRCLRHSIPKMLLSLRPF
jgi:hypothetical protein